MITTAELMVFRTMEGTLTYREVVRDEDGDIVGVSAHDVCPMGNTLEELTADLMLFAQALERPYLAEEDLEYEDGEFDIPVVTSEGGENVH
jgi:hypothetical protein